MERQILKRPTIADLSRASGCSVATVDRVLNRRLPVRDDTARRVAEAAAAIGFHAASLLKQRAEEAPAKTFGFVLQKRADAFYQALAASLAGATRASSRIRGKPVSVFVDELVPASMALKIRELARSADALAVVALDHPLVIEAIENVVREGTPVLTLLSDINAPARAGYIGLDSRRAGRTAAWAIARMAKAGSGIGILVGTRRYLGQDLAEAGFRSFFQENAPAFRLLETMVDLEDDRIAYQATLDLLARNNNIGGIYLAGGGMTGMIAALREEKAAGRTIVVCNELLPVTRAALMDGIVDVVLSTPLPALAERTIEAMIHACGGSMRGFEKIYLPTEIYISENV